MHTKIEIASIVKEPTTNLNSHDLSDDEDSESSIKDYHKIVDDKATRLTHDMLASNKKRNRSEGNKTDSSAYGLNNSTGLGGLALGSFVSTTERIIDEPLGNNKRGRSEWV